MSTEGMPPKQNRTPWIIAGVLGCLVVCLLVAVVGGGAYFVLGQPKPTTPIVQLVTPTLLAVAPTVPPVTAPTQPPIVTQPTQAPAVGQAQSTAAAQPTLPPAAPTQPAAQPTVKPAAPTGRIAFSKCEGNCDSDDKKTVWVMNIDGSNAKKILDRASEPTWSPDGTKIAYYHWTDGIFVANADGTSPQKIVGDTLVGYLDWSHDGRLIAFSAQPGGQGNIVINVVPPDGSALKDPGARRLISVGRSPSWSPDDTQFAIDSCDTSNHCGIFKVSSAGGGSIIPIVTDGGGAPVWSPDGKKIVYQTEVDGQKQLFIINPDGTGKKQLTQGPALHVDAAWSPDGNFIFYRSPESGTWGIWRLNVDGTSPIKLLDNAAPVDWAYERLAVTR
jgi:Tol biopolymer transport system component